MHTSFNSSRNISVSRWLLTLSAVLQSNSWLDANINIINYILGSIFLSYSKLPIFNWMKYLFSSFYRHYRSRNSEAALIINMPVPSKKSLMSHKDMCFSWYYSEGWASFPALAIPCPSIHLDQGILSATHSRLRPGDTSSYWRIVGPKVSYEGFLLQEENKIIISYHYWIFHHPYGSMAKFYRKT